MSMFCCVMARCCRALHSSMYDWATSAVRLTIASASLASEASRVAEAPSTARRLPPKKSSSQVASNPITYRLSPPPLELEELPPEPSVPPLLPEPPLSSERHWRYADRPLSCRWWAFRLRSVAAGWRALRARGARTTSTPGLVARVSSIRRFNSGSPSAVHHWAVGGAPVVLAIRTHKCCASRRCHRARRDSRDDSASR